MWMEHHASMLLQAVDCRRQRKAHFLLKRSLHSKTTCAATAAGVYPSAWDQATWDAAVATNFEGPIELIEQLLPHLAEGACPSCGRQSTSGCTLRLSKLSPAVYTEGHHARDTLPLAPCTSLHVQGPQTQRQQPSGLWQCHRHYCKPDAGLSHLQGPE